MGVNLKSVSMGVRQYEILKKLEREGMIVYNIKRMRKDRQHELLVKLLSLERSGFINVEFMGDKIYVRKKNWWRSIRLKRIRGNYVWVRVYKNGKKSCRYE